MEALNAVVVHAVQIGYQGLLKMIMLPELVCALRLAAPHWLKSVIWLALRDMRPTNIWKTHAKRR